MPFALLAQSPTGGIVTSGAASIAQSGNNTNINQSTNAAVINWQSFSIGSNSAVNFNQPTATSVTLNRVTGNSESVIDGALNANGNVFLINSNGVLIDSSAKISTGGFVASTLDIADSDFLAGNYSFASNASQAGSVINLGAITTNKSGGYVALMGGTVSNQGAITATEGTVVLGAGNQVTLNFNGNSLVGVTVGEGALNALVENKQAIYANGGTVILTAKAANDLLSAQVNNTGLIQAQTIGDLTGSISLDANGGTTSVNGTLDASAPHGGNGGQITTSGATVSVADGTAITTQSAAGSAGLWTIDSYGFTVAASAGNMTAAELENALGTTSVEIASPTPSSNGIDSSVNINAPVSWSSNSALTLSAADYVNASSSITATGQSAALTLSAGKDVDISAPVSLSGQNAVLAITAGNNIDIDNAVKLSGNNAALSMNYGGDYSILTPASYAGAVLGNDGIPIANSDTSGGTYGSITLSGNAASLNINGNAYTLIHSLSDLDSVSGSGYYALAANLNVGGTTYNSSPIGSFSGTLAGLGNAVNGLTINSSQNNVGLIGSATNATIRDLGVTNVKISSKGNNVGALLGSGSGTIAEDYSTGQVSGNSIVGGLIGSLSSGSTSYSSSSANVVSTETVSAGASGLAYPNFFTGGLIGYDGGSISHSDATGSVTGYNGYTGGLVGKFTGSLIDSSYATGGVTETTMDPSDGGSSVGGLVGEVQGSVSNSFATGNVSGYDQVGGLIGLAGNPGAIANTFSVVNSYATGTVSAYGWSSGSDLLPASGTAAGGLVGAAYGTNITNSFALGNVTSYYNQPYTNGGEANGYVGGLVGYIDNGTITGSYARGNVTVAGTFLYGVGGLVGGASLTSISGSDAYGNVNGNDYVGGLVGALLTGGTSVSITDSAAYGNVSGTNDVGGVVGYVSGEQGTGGATISNVDSYGNVTATGNAAGGIVGFDEYGIVSNANVYGNVQGATSVGAVVGGGYDPTITNSQSTGTVTSPSTIAELSGLSIAAGAAQLQSTIPVTFNIEDSDQASGSLEDQLNNNLQIDDLLRYSATIKTVIVDGVEYQVQTSDDAKKSDSGAKEKK
jgi:filamentous hemagglutinin family protein